MTANLDFAPVGNGLPAKTSARLVVAIPTTGRPEIVLNTLKLMNNQKRLPDLMILSVAGAEDVDVTKLPQMPFPVRVVTGSKGASIQRNRAMAELNVRDIVVFLDDDFLMAPDYLAQVERIFSDHPDIAVLTGDVLADGICGRGFDTATGARLLAERDDGIRTHGMKDVYNAYGCNMSIRMGAVAQAKLGFDDHLPLYGWLEDLDFSRRLAAFGRIAQADDLKGVHLGTKTGRTTGTRVGYSQIANPIYLVRKGSMKAWRAQWIMCRNILSNLVKSLRPEPWIDRRGRLKGNLIAARDMVAGRLSPGRILDL